MLALKTSVVAFLVFSGIPSFISFFWKEYCQCHIEPDPAPVVPNKVTDIWPIELSLHPQVLGVFHIKITKSEEFARIAMLHPPAPAGQSSYHTFPPATHGSVASSA